MSQKKPRSKELSPLQRRSREEVMDKLKKSPGTWVKFQALTDKLQEELIGFSMGERSLKISYDPFFKMIFDPEIHKERLSRLLSCIMGQKVTVKRALPGESRLTAEGSLLIMDILTELEHGELVNIEIQKAGYAFPGERAACYSSDLMLRQYSRVKGEKKKCFSYKDLKSVYTIVLIESSGPEFHKLPGKYIHHFQQTSDTGLNVELLQKYIFISLDVFLKMTYTVDEELEAWLLFLSSDRLEDMVSLIERYSFFRELYEEIAEFQTKPEEMVGMYSKALEILDRNTVQYMIDEQKQELERQHKELEQQHEEIKRQKQEINQQEQEMKRQEQEMKRQEQEMKRQEQEMKRQEQEMKRQKQEMEQQKQEMEQQKQENEQHKKLVERKDAEIEHLKKLLNRD